MDILDNLGVDEDMMDVYGLKGFKGIHGLAAQRIFVVSAVIILKDLN